MSKAVMTIGTVTVPAEVLEEAEKRAKPFLSGCGLEVAHWATLTAAFSDTILAERERNRGEIERLQTSLYRIALKDRHYRLHKPKADGGFRGVGGMIATFALTGVNGSYIGDAAIAEQYPHIAQAIRAASQEHHSHD